MSLYLPEQKLGSHSQEGGSSNKFMLKGRQTGSMHRGHSWVFRAESFQTMEAWYNDIKSLTEKTPQERNAFVRQHARSVSGNSMRSKAGSVSSDGGLDDEDEEPFSATASSMAASQGPKQDILPKRPNAGGRFPSDLQVNAQRGLQAPLSPSPSGSSNFGDVQDRDLATAAQLGTGVGQNYGETSVSSPTHAELVNAQAHQDGINPYTYQPIQQSNSQPHHSHSTNNVNLATAGVGGVAAGVVGAEVYQNHAQKAVHSEPDYFQQHQEQAALEASTVAASDTYKQQFEHQAALEAATIAAQDTQPISAANVSNAGAGDTYTTLPDEIPSQHAPNSPDLVRPSIGPSVLSVSTISQLHVPGEYPKESKVGATAIGRPT